MIFRKAICEFSIGTVSWRSLGSISATEVHHLP